MELPINKIYQGDALIELKKLPSESVDSCITSPPYWTQRNYLVDGQIGIERTLKEYINKLCIIFDEIKRILKKSGTCWVVIGDAYSGKMGKRQGWTDAKMGYGKQEAIDKGIALTKENKFEYTAPSKSLIMIPFYFALEMVNRGWILRNTLIWHKNNVMPTSAKDRFTIDFEYVFFFVKSKRYYFETQYEPVKKATIERNKYPHRGDGITAIGRARKPGEFMSKGEKRNKRAVWNINTKPRDFEGEHFATFPERLIEPMINAGCPKEGIILDPFFGSGTTGLVALKQNKQFIGIELNPNYVKIAEARIKPYLEQRKL
ncbi:MAG: site-specific DNA-methyltransferase [Nanoarchaeota archaeon]